MYKLLKVEAVRNDGGTWTSDEDFQADLGNRTNAVDRAAFQSACDLDRAGVHVEVTLKEDGAKAVYDLIMSEQCWNHYTSSHSMSGSLDIPAKAGLTETIMSGPTDMSQADVYAAYPVMDPSWIEQNLDVPPPPAEVDDGAGSDPEPAPDFVPGQE